MIRTALIGLGRMGQNHAKHLYEIPECKLVAVCSIREEELKWAKENLGDVSCYDDFDTLLEKEDIDALFIASATSEHATQIIKGVRKGLHIFCEKPLGENISEVHTIQKTLSESLSKDKVFMLGFVRRFDLAYSTAKKKILEGIIGEPFLVKSLTADHDGIAEFQLNFTKVSGGIFHDTNIHDIDISRWLLGSKVKKVYAIGSSIAHPEFGKIGDADNTITTCQCEDGKMTVLLASRTACHGHGTQAEVHGTKGILRIGHTPEWADVQILDSHGIRKECVYSFFDRFKDAFLTEVKYFFSCIKKGTTNDSMGAGFEDGVYASQVAEACSVSFREKRIVDVSEV